MEEPIKRQMRIIGLEFITISITKSRRERRLSRSGGLTISMKYSSGNRSVFSEEYFRSYSMGLLETIVCFPTQFCKLADLIRIQWDTGHTTIDDAAPVCMAGEDVFHQHSLFSEGERLPITYLWETKWADKRQCTNRTEMIGVRNCIVAVAASRTATTDRVVGNLSSESEAATYREHMMEIF